MKIAHYLLLLCAMVVTTMPLATSTLATPATFTPLGFLGGTPPQSQAMAVSADGRVVVGISNNNIDGENRVGAFRWIASTGMEFLGYLPNSFMNSSALGVSGDGSVVVGQSGSAGFRWTAETGMQNLGFTCCYRATDVSDHGEVVVGDGPGAFRWTAETGMVILGDAEAWGVSGDGAVVVGRHIDGEPPFRDWMAFRWTAETGIETLEHLPGGRSSLARAASADGSVIVGGSGSDIGPQAFRWTAETGMIGLGHLPGEQPSSHALAVSADGSVIVGMTSVQTSASEPPFNIDLAFYWTETLGMVDLRDLLISHGAANLDGWTLHQAAGVSADGRTIVGLGTNPAGQQYEAWIATLSAIPEPSALALGVLLACTLSLVRVRIYSKNTTTAT